MKKQWIWRAMAEWTDAHDMQAKQKLQRVLRDELHIYTLFDPTVFIQKSSGTVTMEQPSGYESKADILRHFYVHMPDMFSRTHNLAIEIDGDWHFNSKKGVKQTNARNENYDFARIKLLWLTPKEILDSRSDEALTDLVLGLLAQPHTFFVP